MLVLGHAGITLGAAIAGTTLLPKNTRGKTRLEKLSNFLDIRLLLLGSLLPDVIDKPLGHLFFQETLANGRIIAHSLLFIFLLAALALIFYKIRGKTWLLALAAGSFSHILFDQMWLIPETLFWPLFGFGFEKTDISNWVPNMLSNLLNKPSVFIPEIIGGLILLWFGMVLIKRKALKAFVLKGDIK